MHIVFHAHRADVTDALQQKAEAAVRKLATRLRGATDASVRFAEDAGTRRCELVLRVARRAPLVAEATSTRYETALATAIERLETHVAHVKAERARRLRRLVTPPRDSADDTLLDAQPPAARRAAGP